MMREYASVAFVDFGRGQTEVSHTSWSKKV